MINGHLNILAESISATMLKTAYKLLKTFVNVLVEAFARIESLVKMKIAVEARSFPSINKVSGTPQVSASLNNKPVLLEIDCTVQ